MSRTLILIAALSLISPVAAQRHKENSETWSVTSAWIKEVSSRHQAAAIVFAFGALNQKLQSLVALREDREQVSWAVRIKACGTSILAKVATKNPAMQEYFHSLSALNSKLARGEIHPDAYLQAEKQLQFNARTILDDVDNDSLTATKVQYKKRVEDTERSLIVYAMECAS
jgi:hypothetical protein